MDPIYFWEDHIKDVPIYKNLIQNYVQIKEEILNYLDIVDTDIEIPANTYVSVPNQIILSGNRPKFRDIKWKGLYPIGDTSIIDSATAFYEGMGRGYEDKFMILSFHLKWPIYFVYILLMV